MVLMMVAALGSFVIELSKVGVMTRPACASGPSTSPPARRPARNRRLKGPRLTAKPAMLSVFIRGVVPLQLDSIRNREPALSMSGPVGAEAAPCARASQVGQPSAILNRLSLICRLHFPPSWRGQVRLRTIL